MEIHYVVTMFLFEGTSFEDVERFVDENVPKHVVNRSTYTYSLSNLPDGRSLKTVTISVKNYETDPELGFPAMERWDRKFHGEGLGVIRRRIDTLPIVEVPSADNELPEGVFWSLGSHRPDELSRIEAKGKKKGED